MVLEENKCYKDRGCIKIPICTLIGGAVCFKWRGSNIMKTSEVLEVVTTCDTWNIPFLKWQDTWNRDSYGAGWRLWYSNSLWKNIHNQIGNPTPTAK